MSARAGLRLRWLSETTRRCTLGSPRLAVGPQSLGRGSAPALASSLALSLTSSVAQHPTRSPSTSCTPPCSQHRRPRPRQPRSRLVSSSPTSTHPSPPTTSASTSSPVRLRHQASQTSRSSRGPTARRAASPSPASSRPPTPTGSSAGPLARGSQATAAGPASRSTGPKMCVRPVLEPCASQEPWLPLPFSPASS